jgi:threonine dehydratase
MPTISTPSKIAATQGYGAKVVFSGSTSDEREAVVEDVIKETGAVLVPPYDHPDIILGQGTMALELEDQVKEMISTTASVSVHCRNSNDINGHTDGLTNGHTSSPLTLGHLDAVIAPIGGGGMLSGIATALHRTGTLVFGAEPSFEGADDARRGLAANERIPKVSTLTIADGLRTPVGEIPWTIISDKTKVRGIFAVTEEQILSAMRLVLERMKVFVEPSAVVGLAVALCDEEFRRLVEREGGEEGWDVGIILSGGNTTVEAIAKMFAVREGRGERQEGKLGKQGERVAENVAG